MTKLFSNYVLTLHFSLNKQVKMLLAPYGNTLTPNDYTNASLYNKNMLATFIGTMQTNLCDYVAYGETPAVVDASFATLTTFKQQFGDMIGNSVFLPCGTNCTKIPRVKIGSTCSSENCTGIKMKIEYRNASSKRLLILNTPSNKRLPLNASLE